MTGEPDAGDKDAVLSAFLESCPKPRPDQVAAWRMRYPHFADDIMELAADLLISRLEDDAHEAREPTEAELKSGRQRGIAIGRATAMPRRSKSALHDLIDEAGTDIPALARTVGIDREIIAELEAGHLILPVGDRLIEALTVALKKPLSVVEDAMANSYWTPQIEHAKASGTPTMQRLTYREIVRSSDMPEDRKAFWLEGG